MVNQLSLLLGMNMKTFYEYKRLSNGYERSWLTGCSVFFSTAVKLKITKPLLINKEEIGHWRKIGIKSAHIESYVVEHRNE